MWFPIFEILAEAYSWTLSQVLWDLTLPQVMRYLRVRSDRIERQNEEMKRGSDNDTEEYNTPQRTDRSNKKDVNKKKKQLINRQREWEISQLPENLPMLADIAGDLSSSMSGQ